MRRHHYVSRRRRRPENEEAAEHMRQRRELSALVRGIDNDVLDLFFKLEQSRFERMADTYGYLFGKSAEEYMRSTRAAWQSGRVGVSGQNAARIMMVLPQFLTDEQRDHLLAKLQPIIGADQIKAWLEGLDSTVRNGIKVIAEPRRGVTVPTFPPRRATVVPASLPPPQPKTYLMDAVVTSAASNPAQVLSPPRAGNQSNAGVIIGVLAVGFVIFLVSLASPSKSTNNQSVNSVVPPVSQVPVATTARSSTAADTTVQPTPSPFPLEVKYFRRAKGKGASAVTDTIGGINADGSLWSLSIRDANGGIHNGVYSLYVMRHHAASNLYVVADKTGNLMFKIEGETGHHSGGVDLPDFPAARPTPVSKTVLPSANPSFPATQGTVFVPVKPKAGSLPTGQSSETSAQSVPAPALLPAGRPIVPVVHVEGYTRPNGTYVAPYDRTRGDGTTSNNWSEKGNVNPITGKAGSSRR